MSDIEQSYQSSLDFLYSFVDYSLTRQLRYSPEKFNLDRMKAFMSLMGDPQAAYPVIHVAGTKGKGSTSAMIASVLAKSGFKVGLYTSPHLHDFVERIQVNGQPISYAELVAQVAQLRSFTPLIEEITTFELTTAIGFSAFKKAQVDIAVIEVGLGGRLDATNIVKPEVSVITSLSMDHMNILGDTLEKIAFEKGGIIKPGVPVVLSPQKEEARKIISTLCYERGSELIEVDQKFEFGVSNISLERQSFWIKLNDESSQREQYSLSLLGQHQVSNAATALATIGVLQTKGYEITGKAKKKGLQNVNWPARFEIVSRDPLIILDCAHNPDSCEKLCKTVQEYLPGKKLTLVFGASEDKDVEGMFDFLFPVCDEVIVTRSVHPRAAELNLLVELARKHGRQATSNESIEHAIQTALSTSGEKDGVLITGSIFIAAAAREIIQKHTKKVSDTP